MKRLMRGNTGPRGELYTNVFARTLLMYRNTPMQGVGLSPAQIVFCRELCDTMPFKPGKGAMRKEYRITAEDREMALAKRHYTAREKMNEHVKELKVGSQYSFKTSQGTMARGGPGQEQWFRQDQVPGKIR